MCKANCLLGPAAEALADRHPLAATIVLRSMIDYSLGEGRSTRYGHAARQLATCAALASSIEDFGDWPPHDDYLTSLREKHGRKSSFWRRVD